MRTTLVAVGLSALGGFGGLSVAAALCLFREDVRRRVIPPLVTYAVGTLLGVAFLDLLPEAASAVGPRAALATTLGGIVTFFALEKLALWRHARVGSGAFRPAASLVLIGDSVHNFMDGALIGATALLSIPLAVTVAFAVLAHEIPHELGDFAVLLDAGYSRARALVMNGFSECAGLAGALVAVASLPHLPLLSPHFLALASASFVYVALADLTPETHRGAADVGAGWQVALVAAGVATVIVL